MKKLSEEQKENIIKLCSYFFYEGMTYEQFNKDSGFFKNIENMSPNQYLILKIKEKLYESV